MAATGVMKKRDRDAALAAMDPNLKKERDAIAKLINEGERNDVLNKWDIGKHVGKVKGKKDWGEGAVQQIAATMVHVAKSTLDAYHRLAAAWPTREGMQKILKDGEAKGYHFGVTHLLAISGLDKETQRNKLISQAINESLTKDDLITRVQNLRGGAQSNRAGKGGGPGSKSARPTSPRAGLQQLAKVMQTVAERERVLAEVVFDPLKSNAPADWDDDLISNLQTALEEVETAEGSIHVLKDSLTKAIKRGEKIVTGRKKVKKNLNKKGPVAEDEPEEDEEEPEDEAPEDDEEAEDDDEQDQADDEADGEIEAEGDAQDDDEEETDDDDEDAELAEAIPPRPAKLHGGGKAAAAIRKAKGKAKQRA